jgi:MSHA pilin protein MshC
MLKIRQFVQGRLESSSGFTMIEIIAVLVILLIVAAIAVSRSSSTQNDLLTQTDIVKSHLRFAQLKALQDDVNAWSITFTAASSSYAISCAGSNCPAAIQLPSENSSTHTFPAGVTVGDSTVTFDRWGSPTGGAAAINLTKGSQSSTINVAANTGRITP